MKTPRKAPGKSHRQGIDLFEVMRLFPDEETAESWFEDIVWRGERCCGHCGSVATRDVPRRKPMPYWCKDCRSYFSVRTGTPIACSKVPLRKWAIAIYLCLTSLKSVSSMKLRRDIGVSQPTAWFMLHRIRQAWSDETSDLFSGPAEVDESYFGGRRRNMSNTKRKGLTGRGPVDKVAVAGVKDRATNQVRAKVVETTDAQTLQGFVQDHVHPGAKVYTDDATAYAGLPNHDTVKHSLSEFVNGDTHTNGIESFWSMLKRAHKGTFHKLSPKHLQRYVNEFAGRHNVRDLGTLEQMRDTVARLIGQRLLYRDLIADNGLSSTARP
ncbi:MAG: IS1595 family transposase [Bryobacterales bacterium]|nr:IS1595 family transposase [Bryobacterales bacterium]